MNLFNNLVMTALKKQLDASSLRQRVTANNLANLNTPGFKKSTVSFEEQLAKVLEQSDARDGRQQAEKAKVLNKVQPEVVCDRWTSARADGSNVDLEEEMVVLASNTFMYQTAAQILTNKYTGLSYVIKGGN